MPQARYGLHCWSTCTICTPQEGAATVHSHYKQRLYLLGQRLAKFAMFIGLKMNRI